VIGDGPRHTAHAGNATEPADPQGAAGQGPGTLLIRYNPNAWETADGLRPPYIGLAHELIHAQRALHGLSGETAEVDEAQVVGFGEFAGLEFTENKIRAEHGLSPRRTYAGSVSAQHNDSHLPHTPTSQDPQRAGHNNAQAPHPDAAAGPAPAPGEVRWTRLANLGTVVHDSALPAHLAERLNNVLLSKQHLDGFPSLPLKVKTILALNSGIRAGDSGLSQAALEHLLLTTRGLDDHLAAEVRAYRAPGTDSGSPGAPDAVSGRAKAVKSAPGVRDQKSTELSPAGDDEQAVAASTTPAARQPAAGAKAAGVDAAETVHGAGRRVMPDRTAPTADRAIYTPKELTDLVDKVAAKAYKHWASHATNSPDAHPAAGLLTRLGLTADQAADLSLCVNVLADLKNALHPVKRPLPGRAPETGARAWDDTHINTGRPRSLLAPATAWTRITDPDDFAKALGPGETGLIVWHRRQRPGHAIAVHRTVEGVYWIEPQAIAGKRVTQTPPYDISPTGTWNAVDAHAIILDTNGHLRPDALEWRSKATSAVGVLVLQRHSVTWRGRRR
jgi:hypothetical protein